MELGKRVFFPLFISLCFSCCVNCLECFVCKTQEDKYDKCVKTIMTCNQDEDMCLTEIHWKTTPYWDIGGRKQYYISKSCATKKQCERSIRKNMPLCTHVWYEDWRCSECCQGDKCNYYIISESPHASPNAVILFSIILLFLCTHLF